MNTPTPGISIIVPNFRGDLRIRRALDSLAAQTIDRAFIDVIVVVNGEIDNFDQLRHTLENEYPALPLRIVRYLGAGAGQARNIGLNLARHSHITFVDDDDYLSPEFLQVGYELSGPDYIVLMPMRDETLEGEELPSSLGARISMLSGKTVHISSIAWALGFNAAKIVPRALLEGVRYPEHLASGEDVVFFSHLLYPGTIEAVVAPKNTRASYRRILRDDSVSRKPESFDFNVRQRLDVIAALRRTEDSAPGTGSALPLVRSQFNFVVKYLNGHSEVYAQVATEAAVRELTGLEWSLVQPKTTDTLVISYCFPPYSDTAANVVAKRIATAQRHVDVISANMDAVRGTDRSTWAIVDPWVLRHERINRPASFANWPLISEFAEQAEKTAKKWMRSGRRYSTVYTRAMWSGSLAAGALIKSQCPELQWVAEFSDPLRFDSVGSHRAGPLSNGEVTRRLHDVLSTTNFARLPIETHFDLVEYCTFALADKVLFTNENQMEVMLESYPEELAQQVRSKAEISAHPVLSSEFYRAESQHDKQQPLGYNHTTNVRSLAYFGNFYENRSIGHLVEEIAQLPPATRSRLSLTIYCNNGEGLAEAVARQGLEGTVEVRPFVPYLEFLRKAGTYDVLVVEDSTTSGSSFSKNPFLPSKYADYLGGGSDIWSIVEPGSPLSQLSTAYRSTVGEAESIRATLHEIAGAQR
ncbi:glycosyltransferase family 2 protein [Corynebacterium cystitidis]|uniref:Glycosyltransferase involved in cell wall bisynthesis n=1 Tax=Corynebacterium cystitidis DSM 20524 TaxID=1121357 RepID=A0A1H9WAE5_9CORY|nr:glycosyltransferase [Corynebacterium cystitidis]WJY82946.1 Putative glycosyltransferase EpsH [Corynebacterium cystitidis DSM 20524]SES30912.1 Glycosyltransferase involved in cell wall bisynthesis [Corynebacterium cystitidis DSM 20524]SNV68740.1 polypeptide N-acetylgalactosaminyltransferase [Corynebacterium cystitidis]